MIKESLARVWKTSQGRRYLSKRAAYYAEAMHRLMKKDRHAPEGVHDHFEGAAHYTTDYHTVEQREHMQRVAKRYWRRFGKTRKT